MTGLSGRILRDFNDYSLVDETIEYQKVWTILEEERKKSMERLVELFY